jgi:hypothetical protein
MGLAWLDPNNGCCLCVLHLITVYFAKKVGGNIYNYNVLATLGRHDLNKTPLKQQSLYETGTWTSRIHPASRPGRVSMKKWEAWSKYSLLLGLTLACWHVQCCWQEMDSCHEAVWVSAFAYDDDDLSHIVLPFRRERDSHPKTIWHNICNRVQAPKGSVHMNSMQ